MTIEARDIIARALLDSTITMGAVPWVSAAKFEEKIADFQLAALTAAGFRIIAPGEVDGETLEKAAALVEQRNGSIPDRQEIASEIRALKAPEPVEGK